MVIIFGEHGFFWILVNLKIFCELFCWFINSVNIWGNKYIIIYLVFYYYISLASVSVSLCLISLFEKGVHILFILLASTMVKYKWVTYKGTVSFNRYWSLLLCTWSQSSLRVLCANLEHQPWLSSSLELFFENYDNLKKWHGVTFPPSCIKS